MNAAALVRVVFALSALGLALVGIQRYRLSIDHARVAAYGYDLRQLSVFDARLNEELLSSRSGLVSHYDGLSRSAADVKNSLKRLSSPPTFVQGAEAAELRARLRELSRLFERKQVPLEGFKSHNAVLRNSRAFLPVAGRRLLARAEQNGVLARRVGEVLAWFWGNDGALRGDSSELDATLDALRRIGADARDPALSDEIEVLLRHTLVVRARQAIVDELVREALALPFGRSASRLEGVYAKAYRGALVAEERREQLLFALAMVVVASGLSDMLLRVRKSARALELATAELTSVNQALAVEREKERELGDMKSRFVSMTSHEFRSPLSAVLSSGELLSRYGDRWPSEKREEHLSRIRSSARQMSQLLDEILLIGTAEAGTLRPTPAHLNLDELSQDLVQTLEQGLEKPVVISRTLNGDPNVFLDEKLLRHLLWNLLENAVKYSSEGSEVKLAIVVDPASVRFSVRDTGIGIPE
ncbi:MAG TPA: DAHL domain-containing protein, partial [Polyangiaceae bacterium]|nr:DAHL domain-containing protein [Polyangiaceae bacterium]